ncbi:MAG: hypothetical protein Q9221_008576 [Calogaya cf. arnoldii]
MASDWRTQKGRQIGLRVEKFPYVHLHPQHRRDSSAERLKAEQEEADVHALPKSDSDEQSPSAPPSPARKSEYPPPTKKRRVHTRSSQPVDLTSPSSVKKERDQADIPRTTFTSSNQGANGKTVPSSSLPSRTAVKDEDDTVDLFPGFTASQNSKPRNTYQRNIHKAPPAKPVKKQEATKPEKTELAFELSSNGFKTVNTDVIEALVPPWPEKEHMKAEFKRPAGCSPSPRSERATRRSTQEEESNGLRPARPKTFKKLTLVPSSPKRESPPRPEFKVPKGLSPSLDDRRSPRLNRSSQDAVMPDAPIAPGLTDLRGFTDDVANRARIKLDLDIPESSATVSSGPTFDFDVGDGNSSSSLSSAPEIEELDALDFHDGVLKAQPPSSPKSKCPLCNSNIRQQAVFCKAHKIRSAQDLWRKKGYPAIEWKEFQARLPRYGDALVGILNGTYTSFYRNVLDEQVKSGKRTVKQSMMVGDDQEGLKMGYYGTKGQRILMDYLMARFASRIRRLAGTDRLVSAAGVAGFVQGVLVPELAVMLVKDDMHVDEEHARVILKESSDIGNLLNEEEDEVIKDEVEEVF